METRPIVWKALDYYNRRFPCFIRGCEKDAQYIAKIRYGETAVRVCLCNECQNKPPETILQGLAMGLENKNESETRGEQGINKW